MNNKSLGSQKLKSAIKIGMLIVFSTGVIGTGAFLLSAFHQYETTKTWAKVDESTLALLSPEMLYLKDEDKQNIGKYVAYRHQLWDDEKEDLTEQVTDKAIEKLKSLYSKIKDIQLTDVHEQYQRIVDAWEVQKGVDLLNESFLDAPEYTEKVQKVLKEQFNALNELSLTHKAKGFVSRTYDTLKNAATQNNLFEKAYTQISESFTYDSSTHTLTVKPTTTDETRRKFKDSLENVKNGAFAHQLTDLFNRSKEYLSQNEYAATIQKQIDKEKSVKEKFEEAKKRLANATEELSKNTVEYPNLVDKSKSDVEKWAKENDIHVTFQTQTSTQPKDRVISQMPHASQYKKITKGSSITIILAEPLTSTTTTQQRTTQSSTTQSPSTQSPTTERRNSTTSIGGQ